MRIRGRAIVLYLSLAILAGCAKSKGPSNDPQTILSNYQLTVSPETEVEEANPTGVLLGIPAHGDLTVCSVGNTVAGTVTNAHCLRDGLAKTPGEFYILFFDAQDGSKRVARVTEFARVGDPNYDDVASLKYEVMGRGRWAQFPLTTFAEHADEAFHYLWAFDPTPAGAAFAKKRVRISRQIPQIAEGYVNAGPVKPNYFRPSNKRLDPNIHVIADDFSPSSRAGNSGGTFATANGEAFATFHWHKLKNSFSSNQYYLGNRGQWQRVWDRTQFPNPGEDKPAVPGWYSVVGIGTELSPLRF